MEFEKLKKIIAEEPVAERTFATGSRSQNTAKTGKSKKGENKT